MLTLAEAAKETGLTKPAIFKSIQKGRVSATKDDKGQWRIDPAELFRVYPPAAKKAITETQTGNLELLLKLKEVETKLEVTEKRLLDKESEIENFRAQVGDLRTERERWRTQAEQITRLLTDQREKEQAKKPRFWAWLSGKS
jgi:chromosome segregation ATPase